MTEQLKACPLCGDPMAMKGQVFGHTDSDLPCILADKAFAATPDKLAAWNHRTDDRASIIEEAVERLLVLIETAHEHGNETAIVEQAATVRNLKETL
jgi:hypothetical protein